MSKLKQFVTLDDELPTETFAWGSLKWLCNGTLSPGAVQTVGVSRILSGQRNPLHYHPNCEEVLHVLAGSGRHSFDGEWIELRAGSTIRIPGGVKHNLENTGGDALVCLISFSSGSRETVFLEPLIA
ncbi:MAG TPA: cupin domain-containing protein [Pirellulales bacterium]|jgi:quercetin dioxygenase-like cupin family protein|nr:cupin domain-containing protein [Pirellulales bacterium]